MKVLEQIRGYRTLIVNGVAMVAALLVAIGILPAAEFAGITPETVGDKFDALAAHVDTFVASSVALLAVVNTVLRFLTKGAVGNKTP